MRLTYSFKLLGLSLSLSIFASATPVDIVASSPAALERREPQSVKARCPRPSVWVRRECNVNMGVGTWRDVCDYRENPPRIIYPPGRCPPNHLCLPDVDADGDETIRCVPHEEKKHNNSGAQTGTSTIVTASPGSHNTQEEWEAYIDWDIAGASVSAEFVSSTGSFVIATNNIIVGKIRGTGITVCEGNKSDPRKARTCYPKGRYDLKRGQTVDFTFGISDGQSGYLQWVAIPMVHDELR